MVVKLPQVKITSRKVYVGLVIFFLFALRSTEAQPRQNHQLSELSGNIRLDLKHGVWKLWQDKPVYQNMTLDLTCDQGQCEPAVWGYAPKFNQEVDHQGTVTHIEEEGLERLRVKLAVQFHPWQAKTAEADYVIELVPYKEGWVGSYWGSFNGRYLEGKVTGDVTPRWPLPVANHHPLKEEEHPRLIFRQNQLPILRDKAKTEAGQAILAQLKRVLAEPVYYEGYVPTGGYHAAGQCFVALIEEDTGAAEQAWQLTQNSLEQPGKRLLEHAPIVAGVALAYDLCYPFWTTEQQHKVAGWLMAQAKWLLRGDLPKKGWNSNAASNWNGRARGAAGLAALVLMGDPTFPEAERFASLARRNIERYLLSAIGDRGFGVEGDHYTTEVLVLTVFPFLQAYRNVLGLDLVRGAGASWSLPQYLLRGIPQAGQLPVPAYGRYRRYADGSLFAIGLGTLSETDYPAVMGVFDQIWGLKGDRSFGITTPHEAAYLFTRYQQVDPQHPIENFGRVLVDERLGFFLFRDRWQDENDFVSSIYLKKQHPAGVWSFPDVGSFRLWGLGGKWATAGPNEGEQRENVVVLPQTRPWQGASVIYSQSNADGSGSVSLKTNDVYKPKTKPPVGLNSIRAFLVDYSGLSGAPGLFAVVDQFRGSINADMFQEKVWVMHTQEQVSLHGKGFTLRAANGATLSATFIAPAQVTLSNEKTKSGNKVLAQGGSEFFVVMTVQQGTAPSLQISGTGLTTKVKLGQQQIRWRNNRLITEPLQAAVDGESAKNFHALSK